MPKLNRESIKEAYRLKRVGLKQNAIAARLGVSESVISRTLRGLAWRDQAPTDDRVAMSVDPVEAAEQP